MEWLFSDKKVLQKSCNENDKGTVATKLSRPGQQDQALLKTHDELEVPGDDHRLPVRLLHTQRQPFTARRTSQYTNQRPPYGFGNLMIPTGTVTS